MMDQQQPDSSPCSICGTSLRSADRFCPSCGAPNPRYDQRVIEQPQSTQPPAYPPTAGDAYVPQSPIGLSQQPPAQRGSRNTWMIIGGLCLLLLIVCCCCALLIAISASQDSALREELEGTAAILSAVA